jgi:hypothetical protein
VLFEGVGEEGVAGVLSEGDGPGETLFNVVDAFALAVGEGGGAVAVALEEVGLYGVSDLLVVDEFVFVFALPCFLGLF